MLAPINPQALDAAVRRFATLLLIASDLQWHDAAVAELRSLVSKYQRFIAHEYRRIIAKESGA